MSHNSIIYNDLGNSEVGVWANINPELDPGRWANLCRRIGSMSKGEFTLIVALLQCHTSLKNALGGHIRGKLGIEGQGRRGRLNRQEMPIVSLGPSGIGGEYQREVGDR